MFVGNKIIIYFLHIYPHYSLPSPRPSEHSFLFTLTLGQGEPSNLPFSLLYPWNQGCLALNLLDWKVLTPPSWWLSQQTGITRLKQSTAKYSLVALKASVTLYPASQFCPLPNVCLKLRKNWPAQKSSQKPPGCPKPREWHFNFSVAYDFIHGNHGN